MECVALEGAKHEILQPMEGQDDRARGRQGSAFRKWRLESRDGEWNWCEISAEEPASGEGRNSEQHRSPCSGETSKSVALS
ncbi:unnamed protein product [Blepharisma stoltei]|uniref:Uncharacterized protein n=1 Tax=Blepharisma stoltei TaxID=1481888 RepID=A0AAU9JTN9_9CILI|nr:unnamed protein product [Blepharisma stoltei]